MNPDKLREGEDVACNMENLKRVSATILEHVVEKITVAGAESCFDDELEVDPSDPSDAYLTPMHVFWTEL